MCDAGSMNISATTALSKGHCFPAEIISHAVWLYFRISLSYRDVEELPAVVPQVRADRRQ